MKENVDLIIQDGTIITLDPQKRIIRKGSIAINGNRLEAVGKGGTSKRSLKLM